MKEILTDALLREFLLGKVADSQRERIEGLFLTDSQVRERVLAAEQELIEDYLEDSLTAADEELFVARFGQTPAQQRQLQINKAIKTWALTETASSRDIPGQFAAMSDLRERFRWKSQFIVPLAVTALIAIIAGAVWFGSRREQQRRDVGIEQELAQLNTAASLREVPPQMAVLELSPVVVRSVEPESELKKTADKRLVEFRLPWTQKERYATYQAEVRRVGGGETFTIPSLQAESGGAPVIRVRLPARMLHRGHYEIQLKGVGTEGAMSVSERYQFAVSG